MASGGRFAAIIRRRPLSSLPNLTPKTLGSNHKSAPAFSLSTTQFRVADSRFASALRCLGTMLPLHSAVAAARLKSNIAVDTACWTWLSQGNQAGLECSSPAVEVYVAGCFSDSPIILTQTLQLSHRRKQIRKGMLEAIPEYEAAPSSRDASSSTLTVPLRNYTEYKQEEEGQINAYVGIEYFDGEDGELSWFNAGVRVGVGIGLGICLGAGIGVGLLFRTYQGMARNFTRRLL